MLKLSQRRYLVCSIHDREQSTLKAVHAKVRAGGGGGGAAGARACGDQAKKEERGTWERW